MQKYKCEIKIKAISWKQLKMRDKVLNAEMPTFQNYNSNTHNYYKR